MLQNECDDANVRIETNCSIEKVESDGVFAVTTNKGILAAAKLVIASGGLSIPKMGASGFGYGVARQFGLNVFDTRAGLVPFTFTGDVQELAARLSGVSTGASVSTGGTSFTEDILFTHRGLSGPAVLQASSYWQPGERIEIDLLPGIDAIEMLLAARASQPRSKLRTFFGNYLPRALVLELQDLFWAEYAEVPLGEIGNDSLTGIAANLQRWRMKPAATEGYRTAEVTLGGVDTSELSSQTMEAHKQPGLYFIGEVVDVTGHLGGFNFQWAWSSGHAAGMAV
jgi:predicted Rossmann fold flavoprotein